MRPTWGPSGADRTQVGPILAPWTLLSGYMRSAMWVIEAMASKYNSLHAGCATSKPYKIHCTETARGVQCEYSLIGKIHGNYVLNYITTIIQQQWLLWQCANSHYTLPCQHRNIVRELEQLIVFNKFKTWATTVYFTVKNFRNARSLSYFIAMLWNLKYCIFVQISATFCPKSSDWQYWIR